jgi:hypothetical protein
MSLRIATRATLGALVTLGVFVAIGCQTIAGVEDVTFSGQASACDAFCDTVMEACPGDVAVYESDESCRKVCAELKPGNASKPTGNTLACRAEQADIAFSLKDDLSENRLNCAAAGPGGSETCTAYPDLPDCEGYCDLYMGACSSISKQWGFDNREQCIERCGAFPVKGSYSVSDASSGDTLACRLYHAEAALEDPDNHCDSAGLLPAADCIGTSEPNCDDYCRINRVACKDKYAVYETNRQCLAVCKETVKGLRSDSGGQPDQDTIGCRWYHSYFALKGQPVPHCSHSGPAGDGICSDEFRDIDGGSVPTHPNCKSFCRLLSAGCSTQFTTAFSDDQDACVEECETLDQDPDKTARGYSVEEALRGNSLKCRLLYAARAVTDPDGPDAPGNCEKALGEPPCD